MFNDDECSERKECEKVWLSVWQEALELGDLVEAGTEETNDFDTGKVIGIGFRNGKPARVTVAWDSGQNTQINVKELRPKRNK